MTTASPRCTQTPLAPILNDLFNKSLQTWSVPQDWRHANASPVYKKGKKIISVNNRPISLTCLLQGLWACCRISLNVPCPTTQPIILPATRLRSKLSCETQLVEFVRDLAENMYAGHQTDVLVMDFSKAFEKIGHRRLFTKLQSYGVIGKMNSWIQNWLTDRS